MAKGRGQDQNGRSKKEARHVRMYHWFMDTAAWRSLDPVARALYPEIMRRYAGLGSNNGRLHFSVREAASALNVGKSTAARALAMLVDRGFIVETAKGSFGYKKKHATEWRLTEFPCDVTHALPSKEFVRWGAEVKR